MGALLLQATDQRLGLSQAHAERLRDPRQLGKVTHSPLELVRQRVFGVALGYPDGNDARDLAQELRTTTRETLAPGWTNDGGRVNLLVALT